MHNRLQLHEHIEPIKLTQPSEQPVPWTFQLMRTRQDSASIRQSCVAKVFICGACIYILDTHEGMLKGFNRCGRVCHSIFWIYLCDILGSYSLGYICKHICKHWHAKAHYQLRHPDFWAQAPWLKGYSTTDDSDVVWEHRRGGETQARCWRARYGVGAIEGDPQSFAAGWSSSLLRKFEWNSQDIMPKCDLRSACSSLGPHEKHPGVSAARSGAPQRGIVKTVQVMLQKQVCWWQWCCSWLVDGTEIPWAGQDEGEDQETLDCYLDAICFD